ncbi:MAG: hypothetical protein ACOX2P_06930 [Bacillota bacterium]|jgi:hypothetical protein
MPETNVRGRLFNHRVPDRAIHEVINYLSQKGYYDVTTSRDNGAVAVSFARDARIESVVNELVPKIEQLGYDTWHDLELEGYSGSTAVSSYKQGRITRNY